MKKPEQKNVFINTTHTGIVPLQQTDLGTIGSVDVMALEFAKWFYSLLNKDFLEGGNVALGSEHFWQDASLVVKLQSSLSLIHI